MVVGREEVRGFDTFYRVQNGHEAANKGVYVKIHIFAICLVCEQLEQIVIVIHYL